MEPTLGEEGREKAGVLLKVNSYRIIGARVRSVALPADLPVVKTTPDT